MGEKQPQICPECERDCPDDDRVAAGMKCFFCTYNVGYEEHEEEAKYEGWDYERGSGDA